MCRPNLLQSLARLFDTGRGPAMAMDSLSVPWRDVKRKKQHFHLLAIGLGPCIQNWCCRKHRFSHRERVGRGSRPSGGYRAAGRHPHLEGVLPATAQEDCGTARRCKVISRWTITKKSNTLLNNRGRERRGLCLQGVHLPWRHHQAGPGRDRKCR